MKKPHYKEAGNTFETIDFKDILKDKKMYKNGVLSPNQPIKTVKGLLRFHLKLYESCITFELKREAIEASIVKLKEWQKKTIPLLKDHKEPTKLLLEKINDQISFEEGRLEAVKETIKLIYRSNEQLIESAMLANEDNEQKIRKMKDKVAGTSPDLLHGGGKGWMFEYEMTKEMHGMGMLAFSTFGTFLDPMKVDIIAYSTPMTPINIEKFLSKNQRLKVTTDLD
jgi:hypothetical protein